MSQEGQLGVQAVQKTFLPPLVSVHMSSCPGLFHNLITEGVNQGQLDAEAAGQRPEHGSALFQQ